MKLHVNENIEAEVVEYLRSSGHDVVWASEIAPRAADEDVLSAAEADGRVVVTGDKDFGELCFRRRLPSSGVILVRAKDMTAEGRIRLLRSLLATHAEAIPGSFTVVSERGVRIRRVDA